MKLDAKVVEGFVGSVLGSRFDGKSESAQFHKECWELCTGPDRFIAMAAPRGHAKSSAITLGYGLATLLFRERKFMLLVSDTESQAAQFLGLFKAELQENTDLIELFDLKLNDKGQVQFIKDSETDIVVAFNDGHKFRIIAKGSEQKLRGLIWNGSRPDIIMCHEAGTQIYTPETGWINNSDYPGAQEVYTPDAYKITFDDGHTEVVSGDHRFLTETGWKYIWEMKNGDNVAENGIDDTAKIMLQNEQNLLQNITISRRLKNAWQRGMRRILIESLLLERSGTSRIKKLLMRMLRRMLKPILSGKRLIVLNDVAVNSGPVLFGLHKNN